MNAPSTSPPSFCAAFTLTAASFRENSAVLSPRAEEALDQVVEALHDVDGGIVVTGHTDPRPARFPGGNLGLSVARAEHVAAALIDRGVPRRRIADVAGRGASELVAYGHDAASYRANRRVEVTVRCGGGDR